MAVLPEKRLRLSEMPTLYNETGLEMYWELYRRKRLSAGKFEATGTTKLVASQPFRRVFPIPQSTRDASKLFEQNEGYKKVNPCVDSYYKGLPVNREALIF